MKVLADDFEENGTKAIQELREGNPAQYANVIAKLMPKLMELSGPDGDEIPLSGIVKFVKASES